MKGRPGRRSIAKSYEIRKSVGQNIPLDEVDGGFLPAALMPLLGALGIPLASKAGTWLGDKIFGKGILRAGDRRHGSGILQSGARRGGKYEGPEDMPIETKELVRPYKRRSFKSGDIPLPTTYTKHGGGEINVAKLAKKLVPYLKADDQAGFKKKIIKTLRKYH